jgi:hypothetical protein
MPMHLDRRTDDRMCQLVGFFVGFNKCFHTNV